ncbi:MAG: hypothetical protein K0U82_22920 [Planctomycetes bacterium]|nr:hypothetical protein [Planctomycetota bacterium]
MRVRAGVWLAVVTYEVEVCNELFVVIGAQSEVNVSVDGWAGTGTSSRWGVGTNRLVEKINGVNVTETRLVGR